MVLGMSIPGSGWKPAMCMLQLIVMGGCVVYKLWPSPLTIASKILLGCMVCLSFDWLSCVLYFSKVSVWIPCLLKYRACMVLSNLPKEWLYCKRFAYFKVVSLFLKERWWPWNLLVKLLPIWPAYTLPQSERESLCVPAVIYLSFACLICFLALSLCSLEF
jgi:hypothetical protein